MRSIRFLFAALLVIGAVTLAQPSATSLGTPGGQGVVAEERQAFWLYWTAPVQVTTSANEQAQWPSLAVTGDGRKLHLVWSDGQDNVAKPNIYHKSANLYGIGSLWGLAVQASPESSEDYASLRPDVAVDGSDAFLVWSDLLPYSTQNEIRFRPLPVGTTITLTNDYRNWASEPQLAVGPGGEMHMALYGTQTGNNTDILYTRVEDPYLDIWPAPSVVAQAAGSPLKNPVLAVDPVDGIVHLAWQGTRGGSEGWILYKQGTPSGSGITWGSAITLSTGITLSVRPAIAMEVEAGSGQRWVHIVWGEREKAEGVDYIQYVRHAYSSDGVTWLGGGRIDAFPVQVRGTLPTDVAPALGVTPSGSVCVAWHGFRPEASDRNEEIYLNCWQRGDPEWRAPVNVSRSANRFSINPHMAVGADGRVHVVWQEGTTTQTKIFNQVYYAHSVPYAAFLPFTAKKFP